METTISGYDSLKRRDTHKTNMTHEGPAQWLGFNNTSGNQPPASVSVYTVVKILANMLAGSMKGDTVFERTKNSLAAGVGGNNMALLKTEGKFSQLLARLIIKPHAYMTMGVGNNEKVMAALLNINIESFTAYFMQAISVLINVMRVDYNDAIDLLSTEQHSDDYASLREDLANDIGVEFLSTEYRRDKVEELNEISRLFASGKIGLESAFNDGMTADQMAKALGDGLKTAFIKQFSATTKEGDVNTKGTFAIETNDSGVITLRRFGQIKLEIPVYAKTEETVTSQSGNKSSSGTNASSATSSNTDSARTDTKGGINRGETTIKDQSGLQNSSGTTDKHEHTTSDGSTKTTTTSTRPVDMQSVTIPIMIELSAIFGPDTDIDAVISPVDPTVSRKMRWHQVNAGEITFWNDFIFCKDLLRKARQNVFRTTTPLLEYITDRKAASSTMLLTKGAAGFQRSYGSVIITTEDAKRILKEHRLDIRKNYANRQTVLDAFGAMFLFIMDDQFEMVYMYMEGNKLETPIPYRQLSNGKGGQSGNDTIELLKAMLYGRTPTLGL